MLTIRMERVGKRNKAQFRIVLQEKTAAPGGRHVAVLGSHDPHLKKTVLYEDKIKEWISKGAGMSDTVHNLLVSKGVISGKKIAVKIPKVAEEAKSEEVKEETKTEEKKSEDAKTEVKEESKVEEKKTEEVVEAPKE